MGYITDFNTIPGTNWKKAKNQFGTLALIAVSPLPPQLISIDGVAICCKNKNTVLTISCFTQGEKLRWYFDFREKTGKEIPFPGSTIIGIKADNTTAEMSLRTATAYYSPVFDKENKNPEQRIRDHFSSLMITDGHKKLSVNAPGKNEMLFEFESIGFEKAMKTANPHSWE